VYDDYSFRARLQPQRCAAFVPHALRVNPKVSHGLSAIGAGGMGEVYRAKDAGLGREVALIILAAELNLRPMRVLIENKPLGELQSSSALPIPLKISATNSPEI